MRDHPLVLLIDDEEVFLEIASMKLKEDGFEIVITHSVHEAITKAEQLQPDLILSDIYMPPGPNGWDLALALKRNPRTKHIKIAFFSSLRDPSMELTQSNRAIVMKELKGIPVFSKMDDVGILDKKVRSFL